MKLLSIAIPCYNSAAYMHNCIETLLQGGEWVEILIVNDGSAKDNTAEIADAYAAKYPTIIKAIHQENKGHGGAVNTGLANATGVFFKVVDSDDNVNPQSYKKILRTLGEMVKSHQEPDLFLANYVYDKVGAKHKKAMRYKNLLPEDRLFTWDEIGNFKTGKYILMHSIIYRTQMLRECGLQLPEHTFYVDNIFAFQPYPSVKTLYYMNEDFYLYYIGREDQSVNEKVMISRIDQQIRVNKIMIDEYVKADIKSDKLRKYMISDLQVITAVTSILAIRSKDPENLKKKDEVWNYLREASGEAYKAVRFSPLGVAMNLPGSAGRKLASAGYVIAQKLYGFN